MAVLRALYLGTTEDAKAAVRQHFRDVDEITLTNKDDLESFITDGRAEGVHIVLVGNTFSSLSLSELGQTLRMAFQQTPLYFITDQVNGFDRPTLMKNGFMEAFLLPADKEYLGKVLATAAIEAEHKVFTAVRLVDIEPGTKLDFNIAIYLPANNKYINYTGAGDVLEASRLDRLKQFKQNSVYVPVDQMENFHRYSAGRLRELAKDSATERSEQLRASVRELLLGMISESYSRHLHQGKKIVEHTRKIVQQYVLLDNAGDWYKKLVGETAQKSDRYTHASNVSTYAALFSIATRESRPDEMAIAGLFHDAGMALLPPALQDKRPEQMSKDEFEVYKTHPKLSLDVIQEKKLVVPDGVLKAITHHHERWGGNGFPAGLQYSRISKEGQLLAMADRFDYLTRAENNVSVMSPDQAIRQLDREAVADPELVRALRLIFDREQKAAG